MSDITVVSTTQKIIVNPASDSVGVVNAGPMGPRGLVGPSDTASFLTVDGQLLTRAGGVLAPITRANLAVDTAFTSKYPQVVNHGATAGTARLGTGPHFWIGSVNPTNATDNDELYRTDLIAKFVRVGGAWIEVGSTRYAPISQGNRMGGVLIAADQTGITSLADLTGFTVTFTAVAGRVYRVDYVLHAAQVTSAGAQTFRLSDGASDLGIIDAKTSAAAGSGQMVSGYRDVTGLSAGAHTLKLRGTTSAGTMTIASSGAVNGRFSVTDNGT